MSPLHVAIGGVEEGHAEIERSLHRGDLHFIVVLAEMGRGAAGAEPDGRDQRTICAEFSVFHQSARMPAF